MSAIMLLHDAINAAIPTDRKGSFIKRRVLESLVFYGTECLEQGFLTVNAVHIAQLGSEVRKACNLYGDSAWASFAEFGSKLTRVLDAVQDFVSCQEVSSGTTVVLLRADVLLQQLARHHGKSSSKTCARACAKPEASEKEASNLTVPTPSAAGRLGPLVFEVHNTEALPFPMRGRNPSAVRFAINRAISVALAPCTQAPQSRLLPAALGAVLRASKLQRSLTQPAEMELSSCSIHVAQEFMLGALQGMNGGAALKLAFETDYANSLSHLLQHPDCAMLVHIAQARSESKLALLRADLILGEACLLRGGVPLPPATIGVIRASQTDTGMGVTDREEPPSRENQGAQQGAQQGQVEVGCEEAGEKGDGPHAAEPVSMHSGGGGAPHQQQPQCGQEEEGESEGFELEEVDYGEACEEESWQQVAPQERAEQAGCAQPIQQQQQQQTEEAESREARSPVQLLGLLQRARAIESAAGAGVDARLVGGFLAAHCISSIQAQTAQAVVLEQLLDWERWEEAAAFMQSTIQMTGSVAATLK